MTGQPALKIRTFLPSDLAQAQRLFASGLMEFAGEFEDGVRRYVDHALQDDMADISAHYLSHPRSNFWVVESGGPAGWPRGWYRGYRRHPAEGTGTGRRIAADERLIFSA